MAVNVVGVGASPPVGLDSLETSVTLTFTSASEGCFWLGNSAEYDGGGSISS